MAVILVGGRTGVPRRKCHSQLVVEASTSAQPHPLNSMCPFNLLIQSLNKELGDHKGTLLLQ